MGRLSFKRIWGVLFTVLVLALVPAAFASAATSRPGKVKNLEAQDVMTTSAKLTWSKVSGADGYAIYRSSSQNGKKKLYKRTTQVSYALSFPKSSKAYFYQVFAFKKKGSKYIESAKGSPVVEVGPQTLRLVCVGNKCAFLEWDKVSSAKYYILYRYNASRKSYTAVKKLTSTSCKVSKLVTGKKYIFAIRSVSKSGAKSSPSNLLTVTGKKVKTVQPRRWIAYAKKNVKVQDVDTKEKFTILKGDLVYTSLAVNAKIKAVLPDGRSVMVNGSDFKFDNLYLTKSYKYYSKNEAEAFINGGGYSSETDWLLWISQYSSSLHFFKGSKGRWREVKVVPCVIGYQGHTKPGEFSICKYDGREVYFYWSDYMEWGQAFHWRTDANWSGAHSSGCIRLGDADLTFLINNCKIGTKVVSY